MVFYRGELGQMRQKLLQTAPAYSLFMHKLQTCRDDYLLALQHSVTESICFAGSQQPSTSKQNGLKTDDSFASTSHACTDHTQQQ